MNKNIFKDLQHVLKKIQEAYILNVGLGFANRVW